MQQYPFFNINETNLLPVNEEHFKILSIYFQQILAEQESSSAFNVEIIRSAFQAVLWQVRRIYEEVKKITPIQKANAVIASQFQYLVNEHFLTKISVEEYAQSLNISANYLSQTIKETTGNTAKSFITKGVWKKQSIYFCIQPIISPKFHFILILLSLHILPNSLKKKQVKRHKISSF